MRADSYIQLWRCLLSNSEYSELSLEAVVCYCVLADRHRLSQKTGYQDTNGRLCVVYPQESLGIILRCKRKKVAKVLLELEECGLITRRRQGINKPDAIYVITPPMAQTGISSSTTEGHCDDPDEDNNNSKLKKNNDIDLMLCELCVSWDYRGLASIDEEHQAVAGLLFDVAAKQILGCQQSCIHVAGQWRPTTDVKAAVGRLTAAHIRCIVDRIIENYAQITNMDAYIRASLYNSGKEVPSRPKNRR